MVLSLSRCSHPVPVRDADLRGGRECDDSRSTWPGMSTELHPLLRGRFSPLRRDPRHALTAVDVDLLLEAARWAPSAGNSQPWAFVVARRGEPQHDVLVGRLAPSTRRWAPEASALVVNIAHRTVEDSELTYSEFADYDLGQ